MNRKLVVIAVVVVACAVAWLIAALREDRGLAAKSEVVRAVPWAERTRALRARTVRVEPVSGSVTTVRAIDVESGEPVTSALVYLVSDGVDELLPQVAGAATLSKTVSRDDEVRVEAPGYGTQRRPLASAEGELVVPLRRLGTLDVRVVSGSSFAPVVDATVRIARRAEGDGEARGTDSEFGDAESSAVTSSDGHVKFEGIERSGFLNVTVSAPQSAPEAFLVRAADEQATITLGNTVPATVVVTDDQGVPVRGASVWSYSLSGHEACHGKSDESGRCGVSVGEPAVSDGRFRLVVVADDGRAVTRCDNLPAGGEPIRITLPPICDAGVTLVRTGGPVPGVGVRFEAILPFPVPGGTHAVRATTDATGRASMAPIAGAAYVVSVWADGFRGPSRVFDSGALARYPEVAASDVHPLRVVVIDDTGTPVPGAHIEVAMEERALAALEASGRWQRSHDLPELGRTDASGRLTTSLAEGARVVLHAADRNFDSEWLFVDEGVRDVELRIVRRSPIDVTVTDATGAAVPGVEVDLFTSRADSRGRPVREFTSCGADREGRVSFVVSRTYEAHVSAVVDGAATMPVRIDDGALESGSLVLVVPRIRRVRVRVLDKDRRPLPNLLVLAASESLDLRGRGVLTDAIGEALVVIPVGVDPIDGPRPNTTFSVIGSHSAYVTRPTGDVPDTLEILADERAIKELTFTVAADDGLRDGDSLLCFTQRPGGAGRVFRSVVSVGESATVAIDASGPVELVFAAVNRTPAIVSVESEVASPFLITLPRWREISITNGGTAVTAVMLQEVRPGRERWVSPPILPGKTERAFVRTDADYGVKRTVDAAVTWTGRALRDATQVFVLDEGVEVR